MRKMANGDAPDFRKIMMLHPDYENLQTELEKLRTELSILVLERDELLYQECETIEMAYMLSVGSLEYKVYELECAILRLKRKVELIQAKKNRQEKIVPLEIERVLDLEFADYQARLNEQLDAINAALERSRGELLSEEETREIKKLYRATVKALHPDLNPDLDEAKARLFHNAVEAYRRCDLNGLRVIVAMLPTLTAEGPEGYAILTKQKDRFLELLQSVKDDIAKIKSTYPYTMKALIQSPEKLAARKSELESHIQQLTERLGSYTEKIAEMLG